MEEKVPSSKKEFAKQIKQADSPETKENQIVRYIERQVASGKKAFSKARGYRAVEKCKIIKLNHLNLSGVNFSKIPLVINPITKSRTHTTYNEDGSVSGSYTITDRCIFKITLQKSDLRKANFRKVQLSGVDLSYANLSYANLEGANLTDANLTGANLFHVNLDEAILERTLLSKANLSATNLCHTTYFNAHYAQKAYFFGTPVPGVELNKTTLKNYQTLAEKLIIKLNEKDPIYQIVQKILISFNSKEENKLIWLWALDPPELRLLYSYYTTKRMDKIAKKFYKHYDNATQQSLVSFATQFGLAIKYINRQKILASLDEKFAKQLWNFFLARTFPEEIIKDVFAYVGRYSFFSQSIPQRTPLFNKKEIKRWHQKFGDNAQESEQTPIISQSPRGW